MNKLYHTFYGRFCASLFLLIVAFIIHSCKKNAAMPDDTTGNSVALEIKAWLSNQKKDSLIAININKLATAVNWQTAHSITTDSLTYLVAKLTTDPQKLADITKAVNRYLIVLKSNSGIISTGYLYDIVGDAGLIAQNADEYISHYNKSTNQLFTGNLTKLSIMSGFSESAIYQGGLPTQRQVLEGRKHNSGLVIQSAKKTKDDGQNCTDWYLVTRINGIVVAEQYLYTTCDGDPACPGTSIYYVKDHLGTMGLKISQDCSNSGGGDGNIDPGCPVGSHEVSFGNCVADVDFMRDIDTTKLSKCFNKVLAALIGGSNNCIADCISAFTGDTPGYKWYMVDGDAGSGNNANTNPAGIPGEISMISTFNSSLYTNGTDLAIARTIIHESMHAYLATYFRTDPLEMAKTYPQMLQDYIASKNFNGSQHIQMTDMIGDIATQLQLYGQSQGYTLDYQYYSDLAWGGLEETSQFNGLSLTIKDRIKGVLNEEQFGTDKNGNYPNTNQQKGKSSTCH